MLIQEKEVQHAGASGDEPRSYQEAMNSSEQSLWEEAIKEKMSLFVANNTWPLKELLHDWKTLSGKWIFKKKISIDGKIVRHKARWVVRGFKQRYGLDYDKTFAFVVKPMSYKDIFSLATIYNWEIKQMNVKTAFFTAKLTKRFMLNSPPASSRTTEFVISTKHYTVSNNHLEHGT